MRTNYIDDLFPYIYFELNDAQLVLNQYHYSPFDVVNLCGGIPAPDVTSIHVDIHTPFASALSVRMVADQFEVTRRIDFEIGLINNDFMLIRERGRRLGTKLFLTQVKTARDFHFRRLNTTALAPNDDFDWNGYYFWAELGYENADMEEYQSWAVEMGRDEPTLSELMQSPTGQQLWRKTGFTWTGNFHLTDNHACIGYLRRHLQQKGIDFTL